MLTCHMFPRVTVGSPQQFVKKKIFLNLKLILLPIKNEDSVKH